MVDLQYTVEVDQRVSIHGLPWHGFLFAHHGAFPNLPSPRNISPADIPADARPAEIQVPCGTPLVIKPGESPLWLAWLSEIRGVSTDHVSLVFFTHFTLQCISQDSTRNHWLPGIECEVGTRKKGSSWGRIGAGLNDPFWKKYGSLHPRLLPRLLATNYIPILDVGSSPISFMLHDFPVSLVPVVADISSPVFRKQRQGKRRNRQRSFLQKTPIHRSCRCLGHLTPRASSRPRKPTSFTRQ